MACHATDGGESHPRAARVTRTSAALRVCGARRCTAIRVCSEAMHAPGVVSMSVMTVSSRTPGSTCLSPTRSTRLMLGMKETTSAGLHGQTQRKGRLWAASGSKDTASWCDLRRWASSPECKGQPQAFRHSQRSPWWPAVAPPRRHFDHAVEQPGAVAPAEVERERARLDLVGADDLRAAAAVAADMWRVGA